MEIADTIMGRILAIDYGLKRIGIAVTDPLKIIAQPLTTVNNSDIFDFLNKYLTTESVECLVLGKPMHLDGNDTDATPLVQAFKLELEKRFPSMPIVMIDEGLTSRMAKQSLIDAGYKKQQRQNKKLVDTVAAALILQTYLETI